MKVFKRLEILSDEALDNAKFKEAYWALRNKYNITDGHSLKPLKEDQKKKFREDVKKLKKKFHQDRK